MASALAAIWPLLAILALITLAIVWRWISPPKDMPETDNEEEAEIRRYRDLAQ
jgi:hypothetical protein